MAKDYEVGNPRLDTEISDTGTGFTHVWQVPYAINTGPAKGTKGYVRIPTGEYTPDNVHSLIAQAVAVHQEVMGR